jgi:hypothetical protein
MNIHLDYGVKGPKVDANPADGADLYDAGPIGPRLRINLDARQTTIPRTARWRSRPARHTGSPRGLRHNPETVCGGSPGVVVQKQGIQLASQLTMIGLAGSQ